MTRDELDAYFSDLSGLPEERRREIKFKIACASDESIRTDKPCVGKHWFIMNFHDRSQCPYCDWEMKPDLLALAARLMP